MPWGARRTANSLAAIAAPAFEMPYSPRSIETISTLEDVTNTMERWLPSAGAPASKCLAKAWLRKKLPRVFTAMQRSKLSCETSSRSPRESTETPALFTRQSSRPNVACASSTSDQ